jgi:NAD(P)-dependent dehydrogenase (short-subunit alcohol dehydrogenase family)
MDNRPSYPRRRSVLITGASTGFGYELARRLDAAGWDVFAGVRTANDALRLSASLSPSGEPVLLDVTDPEQIAAVQSRVAERTGGRLDALVNNAGIVFHAPVEALSTDAVRRQFEVNVIGVHAVTRAFLPAVRAAQGRIVVVGSISGRVAWPFNGVYAASKHAVRGMVEALRIEQRLFGVRVSLVEPGAFATAIWSKFTPPEYLDYAHLEPDVVATYDKVLPAVERAMQLIGRTAPKPDRCVDAIVDALTAPRPHARYTVGNDILTQLLFGGLPAPVKDAVMSGLIRVATARRS